MNETTQTPYLRLHEERAPTLNGLSGIRFAVLADPNRTQVFLSVLANEGGGNFNKLVVPLADLEAAIAQLPAGTPFGSKLLRTAIAGRSSNNHCFYAAVLRHAGLIAAAPGAKHKFAKTGDWAVWQRAMLERTGEPMLFPPAGAATERAAANPVAEPVAESAAEQAPAQTTRRGGKRQRPVIPVVDVEAAEEVEAPEVAEAAEDAESAESAEGEISDTAAPDPEGADGEAHP